MIILHHLTKGIRVKWPENTSYNGREWIAVGSTTKQELQSMEQDFANEGLLLGDAIAKATKSIGFAPCSSCGRRQEWLNEFHQRGKQFVKDIVQQLTKEKETENG